MIKHSPSRLRTIAQGWLIETNTVHMPSSCWERLEWPSWHLTWRTLDSLQGDWPHRLRSLLFWRKRRSRLVISMWLNRISWFRLAAGYFYGTIGIYLYIDREFSWSHLLVFHIGWRYGSKAPRETRLLTSWWFSENTLSRHSDAWVSSASALSVQFFFLICASAFFPVVSSFLEMQQERCGLPCELAIR